MKSILSYKDEHLGNVYIVIPKIREISKGLSSIVLSYDNGDKRTIMSDRPDDLMKQIAEMINTFYTT